MKKFTLLTGILFLSLSIFSQYSSYLENMMSTIESLDNASGKEDYLNCSAKFERIAVAEKDRWIPYYYSSYALVITSFDEPDGNQRDLLLDRAQDLLDRGMELEPEESELHVLQAFLYPSRILVDPMGRGMAYMELMYGSLEKAKSLDPENPRIYFLEGINLLNMPPNMGGGPENAKPILEKADEKFKAFANEDPTWPNWGEEANQAELVKLQ